MRAIASMPAAIPSSCACGSWKVAIRVEVADLTADLHAFDGASPLTQLHLGALDQHGDDGLLAGQHRFEGRNQSSRSAAVPPAQAARVAVDAVPEFPVARRAHGR